ncbi:MAG: hypothetical protein ACRERV_04550 [Methylococcales bacterium]
MGDLLSRAEAQESSCPQFAEDLVDVKQKQRNGKRIEQNKRRAGFPMDQSPDEFDYRFQTARLASGKSIVYWTLALSITGKISSLSGRLASVKRIWLRVLA